MGLRRILERMEETKFTHKGLWETIVDLLREKSPSSRYTKDERGWSAK